MELKQLDANLQRSRRVIPAYSGQPTLQVRNVVLSQQRNRLTHIACSFVRYSLGPSSNTLTSRMTWENFYYFSTLVCVRSRNNLLSSFTSSCTFGLLYWFGCNLRLGFTIQLWSGGFGKWFSQFDYSRDKGNGGPYSLLFNAANRDAIQLFRVQQLHH